MTKLGAPTAEDVARQAGVSRMTVSAALNGARGNVRVSNETRERVLAVATELGYSPNPAARALRRRQSQIIGFIPRSNRGTPDEQPVAYSLSVQVARAAIRLGYHIIEASAEPATSRTSDELVRFLLKWHIDGVIFDSPDSDTEVQRLVDHGLPVVQLMRPRFSVTTATVTVDAAEGIIAAVDHFVEQGHRDIAFLGSRPEHAVDRSRLDCFVAALAHHRINVPPEYIQLGDRASLIGDGYTLTDALLGLSRRPTAILASGDNLALGTLRALHEARVRVPDDMSLISYDDALAAHLYPPLTSVGQPFQEVAERATGLIVDRLDPSAGSSADPVHITLPTKLTIRSSTCPPAAEVVGEGRRAVGP